MIRVYLVLVTSIFIFSGCIGSLASNSVKPNVKVFEQEDSYILFALRAEQLRDYKSASELFNSLYEKADKKEYLYRSLQNDLALKNNQKVINKVNEISDGKFDDYTLIRIKIVAMMQMYKLEEAKNIALELVKVSTEVGDYLLVSDIYVKQKKFDTAVKYLESAYIKDYNEEILDKMSIVLYVNLQRKKDAIAQLETHTRVHGCSKLICKRLLGFYSNENNIDGLLSTYLRLYQIDKSNEIADRIVQIYGYKKDYLSLVDFLEKSGSDDMTLLQYYSSTKNYKKASLLADKLYLKTSEIDYLGQSAIFEYESFKDKNNQKRVQNIISKLEKVLIAKEDTLYLNYLGYLLIDHEIDISKGMKYIKRALKLDPNSSYYLDSLAWGYYKLGECKKAKKIMDRVVKMDGGDDKEVLSHVQSIERCIKNKKGKNKK